MIGILPHKMIKGIKNINPPYLDRNGDEFDPESMEAVELEEMLDTSFDSDAHFVTYEVIGETEWPRLLKDSLQSIRDAGSDVVSRYIVMDWDTPKALGSTDKVPLNQELLEQFGNMIVPSEEDENQENEIYNWKVAYTTKNGGRLIYEMPDAIQVDIVEEYILGMIYAWSQVDVEMDPACKDWTRLFRAPRVVRDGENSEDNEFFGVYVRDGVTVDINKLLRLNSNIPLERATVEDRDLPYSEEMDNYLFTKNPKTRHTVQSDFYKIAKKALKRTEMYECLFSADVVDMCEEGSRSNTIGKYFGKTIPLLLKAYKGLTPKHVFSLFYDQLTRLEPDTGTPCWITYAWNYLIVIWEREIPKFNARKLTEAANKSKSLSLMDRMVEGMQRWDNHPDIHSTEKEVRYAYLKEHSLVTFAKFFYMLGKDGEYETFFMTKEQLVSRIRKTHMDGIIETVKVNVQGAEMDITPTEIQNNFSTPVERIVLQPQSDFRGFVDDMDGDHPKLMLPMYRRNPELEAEYDIHVDKWLRAFFGQNYETVEKWIGNALAFEDGPICALSIKGPGNIGKKLLTTGLEECLEVPVSASGEDICGTFNEGLTKSPFLFINEAWPKTSGNKAPSDLFKTLTAGDTLQIRGMYKPTYDTINPMRIVMTANDHDLIHVLTGGKDLSPESRKATGERLLHFDVGPEAGNYLNNLGGREHTEAEGARWIRGDDGGTPSDFVVAKHFLYLYENRQEANKQARLLVMGNCEGSSHVMYDMLLQQKNVSNCIRALVLMIEAKYAKKDTIFIETETGRVFVTVMGLANYMELMMEVKDMGVRTIDNALKNITLSDGNIVDHKRFIEIDCRAVLQFAETMGMDAKVLRGIVNLQGV